MNFFTKIFLSSVVLTTFAISIDLIEETAVITHIADGDTFDVRYPGDTEDTRIRFLGAQAMEIHPTANGTPNDCWADEATQRLIELTGGVGATVTMRAQDASVKIQNRFARHIFATNNGEEINIVKTLLEEGLVLPFLHNTENIYNTEYTQIAQIAKSQNINIWSSNNHCNSPANSTNTYFEILVHSDANGNDDTNVNDEWVKIKNISGTSVDISNWWLRDSDLSFFQFPSSTILSNNEEIIIHVGNGTNTPNTFYWGLSQSIFANYGGSVYLMDYLDDSANPNDDILPKGNVKSSFIYPCIGECSDNLQGKIDLSVNYDAPGDDNQNPNGEWIRITNTSNENINLQNYQIHSEPEGSDNYVFMESTPLDVGEELFLYIGSGTDTLLKKYWGKPRSVLANDSDRVWLDTLDSRLIADFSWPCEGDCSDPLHNKISLHVQYDAVGDDATNPNGEWVTINNVTSNNISLKDYFIKLGGKTYYFTNETYISPMGYIRVYIGSGTNTQESLYWGYPSGIMSNAGGEILLKNIAGTIAASKQWPCTQNCTYDAPIQIIEVNYDAAGADASNPNGEWIILKNNSGTSLNLRGWEVLVRHMQHHFMNDTIIAPNTEIKIFMGNGISTTTHRYWGNASGVLRNGGDVVQVLNPHRVMSHCFSWGSEEDVCANTLDNDHDGIVNTTDTDDDGDGVPDAQDAFPLFYAESTDTDGDGWGNNTDSDDDNDGISDDNEITHNLNPLDPTDAQIDSDNDGISNIDEINAGTDPRNQNDPNVHLTKNDFNKDNISDILWRSGNTNHLWKMKTDGSHTYKNIGSKSSTYTPVGTGDLNADGITDILWRKGHKNYIWYMQADGTHSYKQIASKSYSPVAIEDFNQDGIADILWRKGSANHIWYMHSDGSHTYKNIGSKSSTYILVGTGDLNADGITDILWRKGHKNYIWYMHADGTHSYKQISSKSYSPVAIEDFNKDGIADILWRKGSANHIWYMHSDGSHTYKNIGSKSSTYMLTQTGDYNGDGVTDILWRKGSSNYLWYMKLDGSHTYKKISAKNASYSVQ